MVKKVYNNSSIECIAAQIISRKIVPGNYLNVDGVGRCFSYKCYRNSEAHILKELNPKNPIYNVSSSLDLGDKLECEQLYFMVKSKKPYSSSLLNHTHRHKAQEITTEDYTYAKITVQLSNIPVPLVLTN